MWIYSVRLHTRDKSSIDYSLIGPIELKMNNEERSIANEKIFASVFEDLSVEPSPSVSRRIASVSSFILID